MKRITTLFAALLFAIKSVAAGDLVTLTNLYTPFETHKGYPELTIEPKLVENRGLKVDLVKDYKAAADGISDDSQILQRAIDEVSAKPNGGIVYMPKGTYLLVDIYLKSNVHLHIDAAATIVMPAPTSKTANLSLFSISNKGIGEPIENVVVRGVGGRCKIDLESQRGSRPRIFKVNGVNNFMLCDMDIYTAKIAFPIFVFGPNSSDPKRYLYPTNGVVKDLSAFECHYGYGLTQIHAAKSVQFENILSEGGVTLRFETGVESSNLEHGQAGGVQGCRGYKIYGKDGNAAVMVSPHTMHNGIVQVKDIYAEGVGIAVRVDGGYPATKKDKKSGKSISLPAGTYDKGCYIENVYATYGERAQIKSKHFRYMPTSQLSKIGENTFKTIFEPSPAIAPVVNPADKMNFPFGFEGEIVGKGFADLDAEYAKHPERFMKGQPYIIISELNDGSAAKGGNKGQGAKAKR
ncbi:MAG: glycosyl hydrolase family 28-related protein [Rikenellaceae bacterium]